MQCIAVIQRYFNKIRRDLRVSTSALLHQALNTDLFQFGRFNHFEQRGLMRKFLQDVRTEMAG